jgi:6-pyruvoyltetrahydropterin/6-carboxytetrahydropterin synthase
MRLSVCKEMSFAAAHSLPGYDGPCVRLHGHEWVVQVEVSGEITPERDMVLDFVLLKGLMSKEIIEKLDHQHLNEIFELRPTAEIMVFNIAEILERCIKMNSEFSDRKDLRLDRVRLYETPKSFCEWRRP